MNRMQKAGGCLTLIAMPFFPLAVFMYMDPVKGDTPTQSLVPGLFFGTAFVIPGLLLFVYGRRARLESEFFEAVTGMVRSYDRFTVAELAQKIGRTELETEGVVARIIAANNGVDLVFHRPSRSYIHRSRLAAGQHVVDRCPSCGAPTNREVVFDGERVPCTFCGAALGVA
ncbi:MAG TPA: hypothetical protein VHU80_10405 [Polyangiaceae bacterium]|nr:hypothetical protein [Polyangiaceae bacterium]